MVTVLWIVAAILCVALCAYGITTAVRRSKDRGRAPAHRCGARHCIAGSLPPRLRIRRELAVWMLVSAVGLAGLGGSWSRAGTGLGWEGYRLGTPSAARQRRS